MQDWIIGLQRSLDYIEQHLAEEMTPEDVAQKTYVSAYHFQRIFTALCGMPMGEYIRCRRLTLAGQELSTGHARVIDVAMKYGYDSPDSFARAFQRFHGILPSAAKEKGAKLNAFSPLHIKLTTEGGQTMEYKIVEKPAFTLVGAGRKFNMETSFQEIPKYWTEYYAQEERPIDGRFGVCMYSEGMDFDYLIADLHHPWENIPAGHTTVTFPAGTWAVFPCKMNTLQDTDTRMWKEWLPACKDYQLDGNYSLEYYTGPDSDSDVELWLSVKKA